MAVIPKKAETRIRSGIKRYSKIMESAKNRDVNESDTVTIITDILADICGYDKYTEITREYAIRGTYCDLAIKLDNKPAFLIEVKAIGLALKEAHLRQAINYAANEGIEWVILTNGETWQAHRLSFGKPIKTTCVFDFSIITPPAPADIIDYFFMISKEGVKKSAINLFHEECQITNKYMVACALQSEPVLKAIKKQLALCGKKIKIDIENIKETIINQVLKREVVDGDDVNAAKRKLANSFRKKTQPKKQNNKEMAQIGVRPRNTT